MPLGFSTYLIENSSSYETCFLRNFGKERRGSNSDQQRNFQAHNLTVAVLQSMQRLEEAALPRGQFPDVILLLQFFLYRITILFIQKKRSTKRRILQIPFGNLRAARKGTYYVYSKARSDWWLMTERNTQYFHMMVNKRRLNNRILRLKMADDQWIDSVTNITRNIGSSQWNLYQFC